MKLASYCKPAQEPLIHMHTHTESDMLNTLNSSNGHNDDSAYLFCMFLAVNSKNAALLLTEL